jgi:Skp family chaperone for outer membrane proteins
MTIKRTILSAAGGLSVVLLGVWAICAQDTKPDSSAMPNSVKVALLDVNKVFKENEPFKKRMEKLKRDADDADKQAKDAQKLLADLSAKLTGMTPGTEEYTETQRKIVSGKTVLETEIQMQRQDFLQREATIYHWLYQEIENVVQEYSQQHHIDLVLRFMGDPVDKKKPDSILTNINKPIIWYNDKLDVTADIVKILVERQSQASEEE